MNFTQKDIERFWSKVDIKGENDCWEWKGRHRDKDSYGRFNVRHVSFRTHRIAWKISNKKEIPEEMCVCHSCNNPPYCNPEHLFLDTIAGNDYDRDKKGRQARGERNGRAKLTKEQVLSIRKEYAEGNTSYSKLAVKYNVNQTLIERIVNKKLWKHI